MDGRADLADGALHLGMAGMADQYDRAPLLGIAPALNMDLGDERAGGVEHRQTARGGLLFDRLGYPVGAEDGARARRNLVKLVHENRALAAQLVHDMTIMHDFVTDIDRSAVKIDRALDNLDGADHARAKTARLCQNYFQGIVPFPTPDRRSADWSSKILATSWPRPAAPPQSR